MKFTLKELNLIQQAVALWKDNTEKYMNESNPEGIMHKSWERQFKQLEALLNKIETTEL